MINLGGKFFGIIFSTLLVLGSMSPILNSSVSAQDRSAGTNVISNDRFAPTNLGSQDRGVDTNKSSTKTCIGSECRLKSPFAFETVSQLVAKILEIVVKVGWILAFFFIIWSGFLFVTAAGSEEKLKTAKATFVWTFIGSCIVLGAQVLSSIVENTVKSVVGS